ncbi:MAG: excinuclease ABC subunit UvrC [Eubacterium sp.]|nr:excinuclease ABC subunit UvrC [Eubacterium sp.]
MYDRKKLKDIPQNPGIYMMKNAAGDIIYVGKAINLRNRVRQYFQSSKNLTPKTVTLVSHICDIETIVVDSELEALILENNLIKEHRPKYNIRLKDDKSYPYIKVTLEEDYPKVLMVREHKKDGGKYFGPFTSAFAVKKTIEAIGKLYPLRRCNRRVAYGEKNGRPCLNYHIGQCCAPCQGKVTAEDYRVYVDEVLAILNGQDKALVGQLEQKMKAAAAQMDFELAAKIRDQIFGIQHIVEKQKIITGSQQDQDIINFARDGELACVQVFNVREGKMLGRDHLFMDGVLEALDEEIITTFVKQYYASKPFIPKEIILGVPLLAEEVSGIEAWLKSLRGAKVILTLPQKGRKSKMVDMVAENAQLTLKQYLLEKRQKEEKKKSRLDALKDLLQLDRLPEKIEAYDISNISGTDNVGGMVVFTGGKPDKKAYRRFKIKAVDGQNDYASMQEMIFRRIERGIAEQKEGKETGSFLPFPQVFCIDGGQTHVDAVRSIVSMYPQLDIAVCGMVKDDHHRIRGLVYRGEEYPLKRSTPLCTFLSDISEEVHRYALGYHQTLRKKGMLASRLEEIPGIGKKRREILMRHFGSLANIEKARLEEIQALPGMTEGSARAVADYFDKAKNKESESNEQQ